MTREDAIVGALVVMHFTHPTLEPREIYGEIRGVDRAFVSVLWEDGSVGVLEWGGPPCARADLLEVVSAPKRAPTMQGGE